MPFSCPSPCCCRKERGGLPQSGPCWASQTLPPPCSQCCPVACPLVVLDPCQTLLCLHPLLISEIVSSLASFYPIQTAFKACLQPTSSRKPSLPAQVSPLAEQAASQAQETLSPSLLAAGGRDSWWAWKDPRVNLLEQTGVNLVRRERGVWQVWRRRARWVEALPGSRMLGGRGACRWVGNVCARGLGVWEGVGRRGVDAALTGYEELGGYEHCGVGL